MNNSIFREKSIQKVQSPDNLNEYIRVSNPGIWILMVSIVFLLLGLCIWGCFGQLRTEVQGQAVCENGVVTCLLSDENAAEVQPGMTAELGGLRLNGKMAAVGNSSYLWKVLHLPMEFFSQRMSGDIQSRQASNAAIANSLINTLAPLLLNAGMMVFYLVLMLRYSWVLTAVGLTGLTINTIVSNYITRKRTNLMRLSMQDNAKLYSASTAGIELIESIKAGGAENGYFAKWAGYQANVNAADVRILKIKAGEYIAIVGSTGCGKSTLLRVLLGFETPQKGCIHYDRRDIARVDLKSLRRKIGVVMQDGKLFWGDIYSNIVVSAPHLTLNDAWEAAEIASVADDIRAMPMGMHTVISEGQGGISGGQRQRLLIARAVASKPKILMFDEATSALDNLTQKKVSDAIDKLKCTRIVIAHRLSTIRHCDRIVVLDKGRIVEEGTYESLIAKNGFFAELVARQRLDNEEKT